MSPQPCRSIAKTASGAPKIALDFSSAAPAIPHLSQKVETQQGDCRAGQGRCPLPLQLRAASSAP